MLAPGISILRDRTLAWPDSCGLISRAIPRLLILTHLVFFIPEAWGGGMERDWGMGEEWTNGRDELSGAWRTQAFWGRNVPRGKGMGRGGPNGLVF